MRGANSCAHGGARTLQHNLPAAAMSGDRRPSRWPPTPASSSALLACRDSASSLHKPSSRRPALQATNAVAPPMAASIKRPTRVESPKTNSCRQVESRRLALTPALKAPQITRNTAKVAAPISIKEIRGEISRGRKDCTSGRKSPRKPQIQSGSVKTQRESAAKTITAAGSLIIYCHQRSPRLWASVTVCPMPTATKVATIIRRGKAAVSPFSRMDCGAVVSIVQFRAYRHQCQPDIRCS